MSLITIVLLCTKTTEVLFFGVRVKQPQNVFVALRLSFVCAVILTFLRRQIRRCACAVLLITQRFCAIVCGISPRRTCTNFASGRCLVTVWTWVWGNMTVWDLFKLGGLCPCICFVCGHSSRRDVRMIWFIVNIINCMHTAWFNSLLYILFHVWRGSGNRLFVYWNLVRQRRRTQRDRSARAPFKIA